MLKSKMLMKLEEQGVFFHNEDGWFCGWQEDVDLTPYLLACGLFEH